VAESQADVTSHGIWITNYEKLEHFDATQFVGVVLDESSILKNFTGKMRKMLTEKFSQTPYRLCCTATPSPNDYTEFGQHADFLGVCSPAQMLATFFLNDTFNTGDWRLKKHAEKEFWAWLASWAACVSKPSDIGFSDDGYILPPLNMHSITVDVDWTEGAKDGELFRAPTLSATTMHEEMRMTSQSRAEKVAELVNASAESWINLDKWRACVKPVDLDWLESYPCYGGLDLADTGDLCSWRLVWLVNGVYYTWGRRWVCTDSVSKRTERGTVPYAGGVSAGHIEQTPGSVIDHDVVEARILEDKARFNIVKVNHDNWKAKRLTPKLIAAGLPMEPFIQGPKSYDPAMQEFDRAYKAGNFVPGVDPVLNWCASNLVARKDVNGNIAPDKKKSPDKIDDMVAMLMAFGGWVEEQPEEKSFWESA